MFPARIARLAVGLATVALPLTALAAPASASQASDDHGGADEPSISIRDVSSRHGEIKVKVRYRCSTDQDDDEKQDGKDKDKNKGEDDQVEDGTIEVTLRQKHVRYSGEEDVECAGEWASTQVTLDRDHGHLKKGPA
jgi:hypothetical protein